MSDLQLDREHDQLWKVQPVSKAGCKGEGTLTFHRMDAGQAPAIVANARKELGITVLELVGLEGECRLHGHPHSLRPDDGPIAYFPMQNSRKITS
jgi:hypothetical protein